jgi:hypothetical protein
MKTIKYILCILFCATTFVACEDFLDRPPMDEFTDGEFWRTESQARTFIYRFYDDLFVGHSTGNTWSAYINDVGDDGFASVQPLVFEPNVVPASDGSWSFVNVRQSNYVIESAPRLQETEECINHWLGVGHFLRGYFYSSLTFQYGDVPYFDRVPLYSEKKEDLDYLYQDRTPRADVVRKNIEDFRFALSNVRKNDGALQINRYVVAALTSRLMLREGTFQKYYYADPANNLYSADEKAAALVLAQECLELAKQASELIMNEGGYVLATDYKSLFISDDLAGNPEVIMYRKYLDGVLAHNTQYILYKEGMDGANKGFAESFLRSDGKPVYDQWFLPETVEDFFVDRDPRLSASLRQRYCFPGITNTPFGYTRSGYGCNKYVDDARASENNVLFNQSRNITDAPCLRLGEVLVNYAEICYELESLTGNDLFNQAVLDISINRLRDRAGMPHLQEIGGQPAVDGSPYDDSRRLIQNPDNDVSPMLWEIRRERRVELCFEGLRTNDIRRWHKLDYLCAEHNPDYRYGAYIRMSDYSNTQLNQNIKLAVVPDVTGSLANDTINLLDPDNALAEGWVVRGYEVHPSAARVLPTPKNYVKPIPENQRTLYTNHGYSLSQTKEWRP